jgi:hypothetical protein
MMHDLVHHIPTTEAFRASHAGPGTTRAIIRDGATSDGSSVSMMLEAMSELMAMRMATFSVRDGRSKRRKGDHQGLKPCKPCDNRC